MMTSPRKFMTPPRQQRGVALILAVLMVAVAATAAATMAWQQHIEIRRTQNLLAREQAMAYAKAAESYAIDVLYNDRNDDKAKNQIVDNLEEDWNTPGGLPYQGATIQLELEDLQGRFNINNLAFEPADISQKSVHMKRFERLLLATEIVQQPGQAEGLGQAVADWLDPDQNQRFLGGAEDGVYVRNDPPYRTADRQMRSPTELRLVNGFDAESYNKLAPLITALPVEAANAPTPLNINTLKAPLYPALGAALTGKALDSFVENRGEGWETVEDLLQDQIFQSIPEDERDHLSVASDWYLAKIEVSLSNARVQLRSIIRRDQKNVFVVVQRTETVL